MSGRILRSLSIVILFFTLMHFSSAQLSIFNKIDTFKGYNTYTYANDDGFILFNNPQNYNDSIKLRLTKFKKNCATIDNVRDFYTDSLTGNFDPDVVEINSELYVLLKARKESNNPHLLTLIKFDNSFNFKWAVNINNNNKNLLSHTANLIRKGNLLFIAAADKQGNTAIISINPGAGFGSPAIADSKLVRGIKHGSSTIDADGNIMIFSSDSLYAKVRSNNHVIDTVVWAKKIQNRVFAAVNDPLSLQTSTGFRVTTVIIDTILRKDKSINQTGLDTAIYRLITFDINGDINKESDKGFIGPDYKIWPVELKMNDGVDKASLYVMTKNRVGFYNTDLVKVVDARYYKFQKDTFDVVDASLEILDDKSLLMAGFCYKKTVNNEFNQFSPYLFTSKTQPSTFTVDAEEPVCLKDSTDKLLVNMVGTKNADINLTDTLTSFYFTNLKFKTLTLDNKIFHENACGKVNMKKPEPQTEEFCPGEEYYMSVEWYLWADYLWNTGEKTTFNIKTKPGIYTVKVDLCDTSKTYSFEYKLKDNADDCFTVLIPEVFVPNDQTDSLNNEFITFQKNPFPYRTFSLQVFDRWGEKVFETEDPKTGWDGNFRGRAMPAGVYLYYIYWDAVFDEKKYENTYKGQVLLLR